MEYKVNPDKVLVKFSATARQAKQRQSYFTIPKDFVDNNYVVIGTEYDIYVVIKEKKDG